MTDWGMFYLSIATVMVCLVFGWICSKLGGKKKHGRV